MAVKDFRELRVYQSGFASGLEIQKLSRNFPPDERFSLTDQIRRSSRSVCTNIAEAWRKRRYLNHFVSKLSDADGEAAETITWLDFALAFGYIPAEQNKTLVDRYEHICSQLAIMMDNPEQWALKSEPKKQGH